MLAMDRAPPSGLVEIPAKMVAAVLLSVGHNLELHPVDLNSARFQFIGFGFGWQIVQRETRTAPAAFRRTRKAPED